MVPMFLLRLPSTAASRRLGLAIPALLLATSVLAQSPQSPMARPDPLDPKAPVPALAYRSSLKPAGPAAADQPIPWREANEAVARIGGWRVYAREAQAPAPAASTAPTGHSGHSGHRQP